MNYVHKFLFPNVLKAVSVHVLITLHAQMATFAKSLDVLINAVL
jgi:hypothetical protein